VFTESLLSNGSVCHSTLFINLSNLASKAAGCPVAVGILFSAEGRKFAFATTSREGRRPTQHPVSFHIVPRSGIHGALLHSCICPKELEQLSHYSDRQRTRRPGFNSRQGQEIFLFFTTFGPALTHTQPPIQWVPVALSPDEKLITPHRLVPSSRMVELYLHSHMHLYHIVLNYLCTGKNLGVPLFYVPYHGMVLGRMGSFGLSPRSLFPHFILGGFPYFLLSFQFLQPLILLVLTDTFSLYHFQFLSILFHILF
jgi:hypothetical protein